MFVPHLSAKLAELFKLQPYEGVSETKNRFEALRAMPAKMGPEEIHGGD
jgi:hypothetical protein